MKQRKIPMRTCLVTKEKCEKKDLIRVVRTPQKTIEIDETGRKNGKGAYLKKAKDVILKARDKKLLNHALESEIPESIYEDLLKMVEEDE